jgi:hypothetical protein
MAIPESQLETWSHQGSISQSSTTYATVKRALEAPSTKYASKNFEVFLQGSYGNDTNIYAESDVDVVIRLDSVYHYDVSALKAEELRVFNAALVPGTYPYSEYKDQVVSALQSSFGAADVQSDKKAVKIKANGNRRNADVVVATAFRRYYSGSFGVKFEPGICFFDTSGQRIANYPNQHSENCTAKHQATNKWFKPMVRIVKNIRSNLAEDSVIKNGSAPSYFLEGLLYNVPNEKFGNNYGDTFVAAMNWILQADRSKFLCANEQYYLSRDSAAECWPRADCEAFIMAAAELWKRW